MDQKVFGLLEKSLNNLLETIEKNGEFEKYVEMLADRQEREQRELRRRAREQKRLELGDEYQSSDTEESGDQDEDFDSYGDEDSYGANLDSDRGSPMQTPLPQNLNDDTPDKLSKAELNEKPRMSA